MNIKFNFFQVIYIKIYEFDEDDIFEIANQIYENLSLQKPNYNLEIEKEKIIQIKLLIKFCLFQIKKLL